MSKSRFINRSSTLAVIVLALILGLGAGYVLFTDKAVAPSGSSSETNDSGTTPTPLNHEYTSNKGVRIMVDNPDANEAVDDPIEVSGSAPGSWSFEASFPISVLDSSGAVIAQGHAEMQGDWMTNDYVAFVASIDLPANLEGDGMLRLHKSNASGLAEFDDFVDVPIKL